MTPVPAARSVRSSEHTESIARESTDEFPYPCQYGDSLVPPPEYNMTVVTTETAQAYFENATMRAQLFASNPMIMTVAGKKKGGSGDFSARVVSEISSMHSGV